MLNIASHLPNTHRSVVEICQALPGYLLTGAKSPTAAAVLQHLVDFAGSGVIPAQPVKYKAPADAGANLWFIHAAHAYWRATGDTALWRNALLPLAKRIALELITNGLGEVAMTDDGLLAGGPPTDEHYPMALNALWYWTLMMLAEELESLGDRGAAHFALLAGRYRRSFAKLYWCGRHNCLCELRVQHGPSHEKTTFVPDPDQLLFVLLPVAPVGRAKQRQIVERLRAANVSELGMRVPWTLHVETGDRSGSGRPGRKPEIVSPLYLAWLAEALVKVHYGAPDAVAQARAWMGSLAAFEEEHDGQLAWLYELRSQRPTTQQRQFVHGPTVAEVARVKRLLAGLGNTGSRRP